MTNATYPWSFVTHIFHNDKHVVHILSINRYQYCLCKSMAIKYVTCNDSVPISLILRPPPSHYLHLFFYIPPAIRWTVSKICSDLSCLITTSLSNTSISPLSLDYKIENIMNYQNHHL